MNLAALMYHDIEAGPTERRYSFSLAEFREHLEALAGAGLGAPGLPGDAAASWAVTFDDGHPGWLAAADALAERGWKGVFFTISGAVGKAGGLSRADVRRLADMGHAVGSHSVDHPEALNRRDDAFILDQWSRSRRDLEDMTGGPVVTASVPGGFYGANVARAAAAAGLRHLFTSEPVLASWSEGGVEVYGRYTLTHGMGADDAVALAAGRGTARLRQFAAWNLKKAVKAVLLRPYLAVRARTVRV